MWDEKPDKRKICWVDWDKLCLPKGQGGLGFRDLETFNDSLLAKIAWRIHENPSSLLARTLLGKYCVHSDFLECSLPKIYSHGWKGVLAGRDLMIRGMGWIVGDGQHINIWTAPWLSTDSPLSPFGPPNKHDTQIKVCDLINSDGLTWNVEKIRNILPHYEGQIKQIFLSSFGRRDELVWLPDHSGKYSTKTGYNSTITKLSCSLEAPFDWWNKVWRIDAAPKVKTFLWKVKNRALPFGKNLQTRGMNAGLLCKRCGEQEDEVHVLLLCPFASTVWDLIPASLKPHDEGAATIDDLLSKARFMRNLPPVGIVTPLYTWVMWHLWKTRNFLLFENRVFLEKEVVSKVLYDARAWQEAQVQLEPKASTTTSLSSNLPPPIYAVSCHVDAAWSAASLTCGAGWCFTSQSHDTLHQGSTSYQSVPSALVSEALALKAALIAARSSDFREVYVFSDSKTLITLLNDGGVVNELNSILYDIRCLLSSCSFSFRFKFTPRSNNVVADELAKDALRLLNFSLV